MCSCRCLCWCLADDCDIPEILLNHLGSTPDGCHVDPALVQHRFVPAGLLHEPHFVHVRACACAVVSWHAVQHHIFPQHAWALWPGHRCSKDEGKVWWRSFESAAQPVDPCFSNSDIQTNITIGSVWYCFYTTLHKKCNSIVDPKIKIDII